MTSLDFERSSTPSPPLHLFILGMSECVCAYTCFCLFHASLPSAKACDVDCLSLGISIFLCVWFNMHVCSKKSDTISRASISPYPPPPPPSPFKPCGELTNIPELFVVSDRASKFRKLLKNHVRQTDRFQQRSLQGRDALGF